MKRNKLENQFVKFFNIFKKLHIKIPLIKVLEHMPKHARNLKDIISNKKKWEDHKRVKLTEECSVIFQKKLSQKFKDLESFFIPCTVGNFFFC